MLNNKEGAEWTFEKIEQYKNFLNEFPMTKEEAVKLSYFINNEMALNEFVGRWDKVGRFDFYKAFETFSSVEIRTPSRAWPKSKWQHFKTKKYLQSLKEKAQFVMDAAKIEGELQKLVLMQSVNVEQSKKATAVL
ncbi:hypothetical protein [Limnohabitans parvus]|uniref:Uncharacterized protein n=1 Tax=Limnohabitans parvus II-B4 TaxID=1293052 RepID=A0A315EEG5_9BURK|nr:hypothetical protein [Limnohabitans parvus]PUE55198.1 hypothetical protein B9Z37_00985 [Limnohabitans parvus II-B4]